MGRDESVFEGKTLDDAVRRGLSDLGLTRAEVMITVLDEGSGGFLGFGARPYRVRVVPRPGGAIREPMEDRGERRGGRDRDRDRGRGRDRQRGREDRGARGPRDDSVRADRGGRGESRGEPPRGRGESRRDSRRGERRDRPPRPERAPQPQAAARGEGRSLQRREDAEERMPRRDELAEPARRNVTPDRPARRADRPESIPAQVGPPPDLEGGRRRRRRRRGGRGRGAGDEAASPAQPDHAILDHEQPYREPESVAAAEIESPAEPPAMMHEPRGDEMPAPELEREATGFTSELLTKMGYEAQVSARADGTRVDVHAVVPDGGDELTGPRGEVRQALQHILNRMINRGGRSTYHLQLEINDFWERREAELQGLARRLAEEALQANGEIVTEYLNSQERRIVHVTLKPDTRVKTYALGTGLIKRVAIAPADYPEPEAGEE